MKKVLLDENMPHKFRHEVRGHDVRTVDHMGWRSVRNGALVELCEAEGIDVLLTGDQSLSYQQNFRNRHLALVVTPTNDLNALRDLAEAIQQAIDSATPGSYRFVSDKPRPQRKPGGPSV